MKLLSNRPSANNFFNSYSLQEFTRATNVRFRLIRVKNLLGHLMPVARQDPTTTRRVSDPFRGQPGQPLTSPSTNATRHDFCFPCVVLLLDKGREHRRQMPVQRSRRPLRYNRPSGFVQTHMPLSAQHLRAQLRKVLSRVRAESLESVEIRQTVRMRT